MPESNIFFGTAFPEQTERDKRAGVSDAGQFVPVWKQEVRDEKGKRRFHGAFTGGFSAGYYNTVGSKEGWTPSQFVSSRSSRHEQKTARPEDFMDEEDLQELASAKRLVATEEFDILGGTEKELLKRKQQIEQEGQKSGLSFLSTSLMNLVTPTTKDSIGVKLLRKMGWKPGQGIGPRVLQYLDSRGDDDNDDKENETMVSLAPKDTPIVEYKQKTNVYGLGYDLVTHVPQVAEMYRYQQLKKDQQYENEKRKGRMGFGVGIFEDEDEDEKMAYDDDLTATTAKSYHHTLYDDDENEDDYTSSILMGSKRSRKTNIKDDKEHLKKKRCSDGHLPLKGFHMATQSQSQELSRWFAPPQVPSHFDELHKPATAVTTKATASRGELTMDARGELLGEKPIEPRSVFDYISAKSKEQLEKAKKKEKEPLLFIDTSKLQVTLIPAKTAQLALKGYMPFSQQPEKHARYIHYLELCVQKNNNTSSSSFDLEGENNNTLEINVPKGLTYEAGMKEINEFIQAARIYRPISSMMSNRFTSASTSLNDSQTLNGQVEEISFEGGLKTEEQYRKEKELKQQLIQDVPKPKLSEEAEAAAMGMFGPLTRKVKPFYPNRLLCKRFNVKNPHPDYVHQTPGHRTQAGSTSILNDQMIQSMFQQQQPQQQDIQTQKKQLPIGFSTVDENDPALKLIIDKPSMRKENEQMSSSLKEKDDEEKENDEEDKKLDYERPAMDIFKAIFENDDDSDDDSDEEPPTNMSTLSTTSTNQRKENEYNVKEKDDDDSFIGPPIPPTLPLSSPSKDDHISTELPTTTDIPFKPKFIKRNEQQATNTIISNEKIHVTTPFQPRLTSSKGPKRRHIHASSDDEDSSELSSSSSSSEDDDDDHERQRRRKHRHSSKKSHGRNDDDDEKDRSHRHGRRRKSRKNDKKKKKKSGKHDYSDDSMDEYEKRKRRKKKKNDERDYSDDEKRNKKRRHTSSITTTSSSRHISKQKDHHDIEKKLEDDLSLWVEKQPVSRRSRAEDLW